MTTTNIIDKVSEAMDKSDYEGAAKAFLDETGAEFKAVFLSHGKHFEDDKDERDIYEITLKRGTRVYKFKFGQSINCSGKWWRYGNYKRGVSNVKFASPRDEWDRNKNFAEPRPYDVLAGMQTCEVGTFENFCGDFGYDADSRTAERVYKAVVDEYNNLKMLFTDAELEAMGNIR